MLFAKCVRMKETRSLQEKQRGTSPKDLIFDLAQLPRHDAHQPLFHQQTIHLKQMEPQQVHHEAQYRRRIHQLPMRLAVQQLVAHGLQSRLAVVHCRDRVQARLATPLHLAGPALPHELFATQYNGTYGPTNLFRLLIA